MKLGCDQHNRHIIIKMNNIQVPKQKSDNGTWDMTEIL